MQRRLQHLLLDARTERCIRRLLRDRRHPSDSACHLRDDRLRRQRAGARSALPRGAAVPARRRPPPGKIVQDSAIRQGVRSRSARPASTAANSAGCEYYRRASGASRRSPRQRAAPPQSARLLRLADAATGAACRRCDDRSHSSAAPRDRAPETKHDLSRTPRSVPLRKNRHLPQPKRAMPVQMARRWSRAPSPCRSERLHRVRDGIQAVLGGRRSSGCIVSPRRPGSRDHQGEQMHSQNHAVTAHLPHSRSAGTAITDRRRPRKPSTPAHPRQARQPMLGPHDWRPKRSACSGTRRAVRADRSLPAAGRPRRIEQVLQASLAIESEPMRQSRSSQGPVVFVARAQQIVAGLAAVAGCSCHHSVQSPAGLRASVHAPYMPGPTSRAARIKPTSGSGQPAFRAAQAH